MVVPYVQFSYNESIDARKKILTSEINLLTLAKKMNSYRAVRKLELQKKLALKRAVREVLLKATSLLADLPEVESDKIKIKHEKFTSSDVRKRSSIESELEEIKNKLANLQ